MAEKSGRRAVRRSAGGNVQPLTDLDLVRVRQRVRVGVEDLHVATGLAQIYLGELGQRIAGHYRVHPEDVVALSLDVDDDLVLPSLVRLDVVPEVIGVQ